jgi:protein SCO1
MNSDPLMNMPASTATTPQVRTTLSFDQKLFLGIVGAGVLIITILTVLTIGRSRREAALARQFEQSPSTIIAGTRVPKLPLVDFTLTDRTGRTVTRADLSGKFLVVNFVFTGCSISCLAVNHRMTQVQEAVASQEDVRLVSLTVDPDSDTPERLAKFAMQFKADTNRWLFLTGEKRMLHPLLEESFLVQRDQRLLGFVPGGFSHTDRIAVMDNRGRLRGLINGLKTTASRDVLDLLAQLRAESSPR